MFILKGQSQVVLFAVLGVLAVAGVGAYFYFSSSSTSFPNGLTGLEKNWFHFRPES